MSLIVLKLAKGHYFDRSIGMVKSMDKALTSKSVALIIKRNKHLENQKNSFSGHSLRTGFATTAAILVFLSI
ncbi:hypothetical protein PRO82_002035 [Candidatus Protochlamydia amoebophila]|nr:hypothetical protein [Candidatus Protochlamydia amoebophila]